MNKVKRRITASALAVGFACSIAPIIAYAQDYSYITHSGETGTWWRNLYRGAFWKILVLMSDIIGYIEDAIRAVLKVNIYDLIKDKVPQKDVLALATAILTVAVIFVGILLLINGDKMHIKDSTKSILVAVCFVVGFPALMSAIDDFTNDYISNRSMSESTSESIKGNNIVLTLGDKVLATQIYDNVASWKNSKVVLYSDTEAYTSGKTKPSQIDINKLATQSEIPKKYVSSQTNKTQRRFDQLTIENIVELLGMTREFNALKEIREQERVYALSHTDSNNSSNNAASPSDEKTFAVSDKRGRRQVTVKAYEQDLINTLINRSDVKSAGNFIQLGLSAFSSFEDNILNLKENTDVIRTLNYKRNEAIAYGTDIDIKTEPLRTLKDYEDMHWYQELGIDIMEGYEEERVYAYDYDFFAAFIDMLIIAVCLIFALLKLCRMLYEIAFMHIFVPLVVATDAHGGGRAKRAIQQLITTVAIMLIVLISLTLYIDIIGKLQASVTNLVARWGLIIAGAFFVIDGSDFIVKMTGMDAGVKSGAATLLGLRSAAGIAVGAGKAVTNVGGKAAHIGGKAAAIGGTAANHVGGAAIGAVAGLVSGGIGGGVGGASGHDSRAGNIAGGAVGATTGATAGAVHGGAEGARRGLTGLFGRHRNSGGDSTTQAAKGSAPTSASGGDSQAASSDTGTAAAPPPSNTDTGTQTAQGNDTAEIPSGADSGDTGSASTPEVDNGSSADSGEREREGTIFTRAYSAGKTVGGASGHPINTGKQAAWKVGSTKAKYDIAKADGTIKDKMNGKLNDFVKGRYKDNSNGNGGNG